MDQIIRLIRQRNLTLALAATTFMVWQGAQVVEDVLATAGLLNGPPAAALDILRNLGAIGWVFAILGFFFYMRKVRQAQAEEIIEDELFKHHQSKSLSVAFMATFAAIGGFFIASAFIAIPAAITLRALLIVIVCAPIFTFLIVSRDKEVAE